MSWKVLASVVQLLLFAGAGLVLGDIEPGRKLLALLLAMVGGMMFSVYKREAFK